SVPFGRAATAASVRGVDSFITWGLSAQPSDRASARAGMYGQFPWTGDILPPTRGIPRYGPNLGRLPVRQHTPRFDDGLSCVRAASSTHGLAGAPTHLARNAGHDVRRCPGRRTVDLFAVDSRPGGRSTYRDPLHAPQH